MDTQSILVVDDIEEMRLTLKLWLERSGYRVLLAEDGLQALEIAKRELPDLVLLDIGIGPQGGLASAAEIRAQDGLRDVPIIAVTAYDSPGLRLDAERAGFREYVTKPFVHDELGRLIEELLREAAAQRSNATG